MVLGLRVREYVKYKNFGIVYDYLTTTDLDLQGYLANNNKIATRSFKSRDKKIGNFSFILCSLML